MQRGALHPIKLAQKSVTAKTVHPGASSQLYIAHGLLGNAGNWATASRRLVEHPALQDKLRCAISVDMRNHGNSGHSSDHTNAALASDLEAVVLREQQALSRAFGSDAARCTTQSSILIGHSMGGLAVMGMLLRRANEERLLPSWVDSCDEEANRSRSDHEGGRAAGLEGKHSLSTNSYGAWPSSSRRRCSAWMRAVNEEFDFASSQPISKILFDNSNGVDANTGGVSSGGDDSALAARIPLLGRISAAVIVDVTPTMRLGEQRSSADNVKETLERMTQVRLDQIHSYGEAQKELIRVGMTDEAMRNFVTTNLVLDPTDRTRPAQWRCNLSVLAGDYGSFQPSITKWFSASASPSAAASEATAPPLKASTLVAPMKPSMLPVLFVFGGHSPYNEPEHRRAISNFFPKAHQVEVPGAGHFVHYEKTAEFADAVAPFIAAHTCTHP